MKICHFTVSRKDCSSLTFFFVESLWKTMKNDITSPTLNAPRIAVPFAHSPSLNWCSFSFFFCLIFLLFSVILFRIPKPLSNLSSKKSAKMRLLTRCYPKKRGSFNVGKKAKQPADIAKDFERSASTTLRIVNCGYVNGLNQNGILAFSISSPLQDFTQRYMAHQLSVRAHDKECQWELLSHTSVKLLPVFLKGHNWGRSFFYFLSLLTICVTKWLMQHLHLRKQTSMLMTLSYTWTSPKQFL